ncbi:DUF805 domain-containing protein [Novosphingobium beihaiensis]|uniref:DUF805 domain-containing protein n=1 Tax=Novosphingobium beihaiensis TaxID=2930389 RepID=A0ABT0BM94_9SPHN|nr:DUF805 domain-containing protein [Novosphingobium beihaiensis]MCJ2186170.1 DUF805 domain-containing protein [Novosphingobium beihaiensis]
MRGELPLFGQAIKRSFTAAGRARRTEIIIYIVGSQLLFSILAGLGGLFLADDALGWVRFATSYLPIIPLFALSARRLHDFGQSGKWTALLGLVVARNLGLDLALRLGGWEARAMIESPLSYVDWLFFLPFAWLYITLLIAPGSKSANRYGPDPREDAAGTNKTAGPGNPEPAA